MKLWTPLTTITTMVFVVCVASCAKHNSNTDAHLVAEGRRLAMVMNVDACREAVKRDSNNADAHFCIAENSIGHNNGEAVRELRQVVRIQPDNRKARFLLAYTLVKVGQTQESRTIYQQLSLQNDMWGQSARRNLQRLEKQ